MSLKKGQFSKALLIASFLWLIVINSGDLGSLDNELRLDMSHAWWTHTSEITTPLDARKKIRGDIRFGVVGVDGNRYIAYEEGQSLLMLPGDFIGSQLFKVFPTISQEDWRNLATSLLIFIPLNVAVVMAGNYLLKLFGFSNKVSALASLLFLFGTTVLHYAQVHQQNNQILLLIILGYATILCYAKTNQVKFLLFSGLAVGGSILIRITCILHGLTVLLFLVGIVFYQRQYWQSVIKPVLYWMAGIIPFSLLGRIFAHFRYGSFFLTAKKVEQIQLNSDPLWDGMASLPANYPLINSPWVGLFGPIFNLGKSIFIYDPLLFPCVVVGIQYWKKMSPYVKIYLMANLLNIALHFAAYSRFIFWHGDAAWASRYHVTSIHLFLIPLLGYLIESLTRAKRWWRWFIQSVIIFSIIVQFASVTMHYPLEIYQRKFGVPGSQYDFRIVSRLNNIVCFIKPDVNKYCIDGYPKLKKDLEYLYYVRYLPFNYQFKYRGDEKASPFVRMLFFLWVLVLILAILYTIFFLKLVVMP